MLAFSDLRITDYRPPLALEDLIVGYFTEMIICP